jgi:Ankyrin repeats (many copies)
MPTTPLPDRPDFAQLRTQAKELRRQVQAGEPAALAQVAEHHPDVTADAQFRLADAQLVVARGFGFASWARLKRHVELVNSYTRRPDLAEVTGDPAHDVLLLGDLVYGNDSPERRQEARRLLAEHPGLATASIFVAAATADADQVRRFVAADPASAHTRGGPHGWEPLLYLTYSRVDPDVSEAATLTTARVLLDAGADPNAGFLHNGLPSAFTALTGAFGEGELGPERQPRHPHWRALARVLLEAGADPNDSQGVYNRMFEPGDEHLDLLFAYGLGTGTGGPWRARLGDAALSPSALLRGQLGWAVTHNLVDRVKLLIGHGTDVNAPFSDALPVGQHRRPVDEAARLGHGEIVDLLVEAGSAPPDLSPPEALVAAAMAGDRHETARLAADVSALAAARAQRPIAILEATVTQRPTAVSLLAELGFDVNAAAPPRQGLVVGVTALHQAASDGDRELVELLLALGADPNARDSAYRSTPKGWAAYTNSTELVALLEPLTDPDPD